MLTSSRETSHHAERQRDHNRKTVTVLLAAIWAALIPAINPVPPSETLTRSHNSEPQ